MPADAFVDMLEDRADLISPDGVLPAAAGIIATGLPLCAS